MPDKELQEIIESLSPIERKIIPYLNQKVPEIIKNSGLDSTSVIRALQFLSNKEIIVFTKQTKELVELGTNGIYYKKTHLPERKLLSFLESNNHSKIEEAESSSKLSDNEFKAALGALKSKAFIELKNGKISLKASKEELIKKTIEEQLLEILPIEQNKLNAEQLLALQSLQKRKDIIKTTKKTIIDFELTPLGEQLAGKEISSNLIEEVTPELIKSWKTNKKFRRYDIQTKAPAIYPGKKHFVSQAIEYAKKIWLEMGFKEMDSTLAQVSFWNFDALFTPQDHPVREMHDTFFISGIKGSLPQKPLVEKVKQAHEKGVSGSKGWQYSWSREEAQSVVLRTHTTSLSAKTLSNLNLSELPEKFFALGKCFRNETVDWSHGFEFNQTEGIVVDKEANFSHLLGYLKEFFSKMGFEKIKFVPAYFPYTEPSVEIHFFHPEKKLWLELGGAGIFRPEVVVPLFGEYIPVLAWGPGFDRILMDYYKIKDLRELYQNDLTQLRNIREWIK